MPDLPYILDFKLLQESRLARDPESRVCLRRQQFRKPALAALSQRG
jgi:hypothetical protein